MKQNSVTLIVLLSSTLAWTATSFRQIYPVAEALDIKVVKVW